MALGSLLLNPNEMKHIESIQPEYAAGDLSRLLVSEPDATASAALTALLHNVTGCAIPPTADLPESEVEELVPLCLSILRRHWTTPLTALGDGTTPMSLADLMRRLIGDRVQGNEAWSIPPFNANIPTAVAALTQRHIDDGLTLTLTDGGDGTTDGSTTSPTTMPLPDGLSLAQLLCGKGDLLGKVVEIIDDNIGWTMTKNLPTNITGNLTKLRLGCGNCNTSQITPFASTLEEILMPNLEYWAARGNVIYNNPNIVELSFQNLEQMDNGFTYDAATSDCFISTCQNLKKVSLPKLKQYGVVNGSSFSNEGMYCCLIHSCENLEEVYLPSYTGYKNWRIVRNVPNLRKLVLGVISSGVPALYGSTAYPFDSCVNLVHLEIQGCTVSLDLRSWNPTTALSERLPEFLSNFKTYIANRLTDQGSGLTLTLSQAVRDAIQTDPDIVNIITSKGWTISPAPSV